eukprot:CAMPEP_0168518762 /NCGR_PEP_ID=MMETSP0405-20121227/6905_1 /TAXON_ID=498012 /ORGANISM="Trichosphaerium sp, Strain Am-I-7 wt" /LENGTH=249 /DNA_ID=CAMNT_0008539155 /DNA_START=134 /DNA_END=883 /DNA_ORIENTATION=-
MNIHSFVHHSYPHQYNRLEGLLEHINEYDIVCLQEVFSLHTPVSDTGVRKKRILDVWEGHHVKSKRPERYLPCVQDSGLMILSKFPWVASNSIVFKKWSYTEILCSKGALHAHLKIGDESLHIITAHLDAHSKGVREKQLQQIKDELIAPILKSDPNAKIVASGDWNIDAIGDKESYGFLQKTLAPLVNIVDEDPTIDHPITFPRIKKSLDHILYKDIHCTMSTRVVEYTTPDGVPVSDHLGVSASFSV